MYETIEIFIRTTRKMSCCSSYRSSVMILFDIWFAPALLNLWILCGGLYNNLALTPPMGWSAWGRFRCNINCRKFPKDCISETLFREIAERMATDGYMSAGYQYVLIDDCWLSGSRDSSGRLRPHPKRFPSGIKNLSDHIHSLGLKFGIYEDYGIKTCEGYPGIQFETMYRDAETFYNWDVDYVKLDGCYSDPLDMKEGFEKFGQWLNKFQRPMVYACSWPAYQLNIGISPNYTEAAEICNSWRNYKDVQDSWRSVRQIMSFYGDHQEEFADYAGPGHWNDPDMLVIGNFGLSYDQAKIQMAIWAVLAAPLIMSHDLRAVKSEFRDILLNPMLIGINQDPLGIQGRRIYMSRSKGYEVWTRPVSPVKNNLFSWAIVIVNLSEVGEPNSIKFPLKYTELRERVCLYDFFNLFDTDDIVKITNKEELITRIPPLGVNIYKAVIKEWEDCYIIES